MQTKATKIEFNDYFVFCIPLYSHSKSYALQESAIFMKHTKT